jgi:uncharacterized membrane protein
MYKTLLIYFIVGGFLGYIWEKCTIKKENVRERALSYIFNTNIPFLLTYAFGAVFLYLINKKLEHLPVFEVGLYSTFLLTIFELAVGYLSTNTFGYKSWDYETRFLGGYVSMRAIGAWLALSIAFSYMYRQIHTK